MKATVHDIRTGKTYQVLCAEDCRCKTSRSAYESAKMLLVSIVQMGCILVTRDQRPITKPSGRPVFTRVWKSITEVKDTNKIIGNYFFSPGTMGAFDSRIESGIICNCYFVSSEQFDHDSPRLYSVRKVCDNGRVFTMGEHGTHKTRDAAVHQIFVLTNAEGEER